MGNIRSVFAKYKLQLLIVFILLLATVFTVIFIRNRQDIRRGAASNQVSISFNPSSKTVAPGQSFDLGVNLNTNGLNVSAVKLKVTYDGSRISATGASHGLLPVYLEQPSVSSGTITATFGLQCQDSGGSATCNPLNGTGEIAVLHFVALNSSGSSAVAVDSSTAVASMEYETGATVTGSTASVTVSGSTATPIASATPSPTQPPQGTVSVKAIEDTYSDSANPSVNYGNSVTLQSDNSPSNKTSYLKFDLANVPTVSSAKIRIKTANTTDANSADQHVVRTVSSNSWTEGGLTYSNRPSVGNQLASFVPASIGTWYEMDITQHVANNRGNIISLAIDTIGADGMDVDSSETANSPELLINTTSTATPTPSPSPTPTKTPTPTPTKSPTPAPTSTPVASVTPAPTGLTCASADFNLDGKLNILDYSFFFENFGKTNFDSRADLNKDGKVNIIDYVAFFDLYRACP